MVTERSLWLIAAKERIETLMKPLAGMRIFLFLEDFLFFDQNLLK